MSDEIALFIRILVLRWMMQGASGNKATPTPKQRVKNLERTIEIYKEKMWCIGMFMHSLLCVMQADIT